MEMEMALTLGKMESWVNTAGFTQKSSEKEKQSGILAGVNKRKNQEKYQEKCPE